MQSSLKDVVVQRLKQATGASEKQIRDAARSYAAYATASCPQWICSGHSSHKSTV